ITCYIVVKASEQLVAFVFLLAFAPGAGAVEFRVDTSRLPELQTWARGAAKGREIAYPIVCEELASPGVEPPRVIRVASDPRYAGSAGYDGTEIVLSRGGTQIDSGGGRGALSGVAVRRDRRQERAGSRREVACDIAADARRLRARRRNGC